MRNFLFAFIFFLSCSSYNTSYQTVVTQQSITDFINDASVASFNFLVENYDQRETDD